MSDQVMNGDTTEQKAEGTTEGKPEVVAEVKKVEILKIGLNDLAVAIASAFTDQTLVVRKTDSDSYRIIGTAENGDINWKKGLIYVVNQYATGSRIELQLYSPKKGAHLAEFKDEFNEFSGAKIGEETIEQLPFGLATRLRVKLPHALGIEKAAELGAAFIKLVNSKVEEIRAKITLPEKVAKKAPKVKAAPAESKAEAKKGAKSKAKSKKPAPVVEKVETPALDPALDAAIGGIAESLT